MFKPTVLTLACSLAALLPGALSAQKYEADKYTQEADKYIGLAMTRGDVTSRQQLYHKALDVLRTGMTAAPDNGKVWFTTGIVYVGLERYAEADEAFDKALAINPAAAAEIETERASGWLQAFTTGAALMDKDQTAEALVALEAAEILYGGKRPEGEMNIAGIYAARGDSERAEASFRRAAAAAQGDLYATQDTAIQRTWREYVEIANLNIAQVRAAAGNVAFEAKDYDAARAAYARAIEMNPFSRDYLTNAVQARYAKVIILEDAIKADTSKLAASRPELMRLYSEILADIPKVRAFDPMSANILLIQADVVRHQGDLQGGDTQPARKASMALEQQADGLPFEVTDLAIQRGEGTIAVSGKVLNKTLAPGTVVTLKVTLLGSKGESIGEVSSNVNAGEKATATSFSETTPVTGLVAGWKYEVVKP